MSKHRIRSVLYFMLLMAMLAGTIMLILIRVPEPAPPRGMHGNGVVLRWD